MTDMSVCFGTSIIKRQTAKRRKEQLKLLQIGFDSLTMSGAIKQFCLDYAAKKNFCRNMLPELLFNATRPLIKQSNTDIAIQEIH